MLWKLINTLSNPILFYFDKEGNAVFRNYNIFENTGILYRKEITKQNVGKTLEYRFELDKYLKTAYILLPIILYLIFIHVKLTLSNILAFEFWWIFLTSLVRVFCSYKYSIYLQQKFGQYENINFIPPVSPEKNAEFRNNFYSKIIITCILLTVFFIPALLLKYGMKWCLNSKNPKYTTAITFSKVYTAFYPKIESVYDMRAYARFMKNDLEGALEDYKTVLDLSSKNFTKKDYARFANLLYLEKQLSSPENALVEFSDYITRKKMSVLEESQMLWIKSIFSVENNMPEMIIQDYNDLLLSLKPKDVINNFYITCDKAYVLYLMGEYVKSLDTYNTAIEFASSDPKKFAEELKSLYAERGFVKRQLGDMLGAEDDFQKSGIDIYYEMDKYEPSYRNQTFLKDF